MERCIAGMEPDQKTDIPDFMTPHKTLEIMYKLMEENSVTIYNYCKETISKGMKVNTQDPNFMMGLQEKLVKCKKESTVLNKSGLMEYNEHPEKIMAHTRKTFLR